jgi:Response regulator containing CheY-like receiver, AAA-type ATPase, and DNA-binding domains
LTKRLQWYKEAKEFKSAMKKILLIEDEELIIRLLGKKLAGIGYEVILAMDGQEGLEKMKKDKPDLILLDIVMPRKGGFDVMEEMRKDPDLAKIPVIIVSNSGQPLELDRAKKLGAVDWLVKTEFDPKEVVEKIKKHLNPAD